MPTLLGKGEGRCPVGRNEHMHHGDTVVRVQASWERFAEITPGRAYFQQGRAATCKDSLYEASAEAVRGFRSGA